MSITIDFETAGSARWHTVPLGKEFFEVQVRAPDYQALVRDHELILAEFAESQGARAEHRLLSTIVGWQGLVDGEGKEIPFSPEMLRRVIGARPELFAPLMRLADAAFRGLGEDAEKN